MAPDDGDATTVVRELRVPRTALGLVVGLALALAGVLFQAVTRNPLAEPRILGVSAGASFGVVLAIAVFGVGTLAGYVWFGIAGALLAGLLVFAIANRTRDGASPVTLALVGAALDAGLGAIVYALLSIDARTFEEYRFWVVGGLTGRDVGVAGQVLPFVLAGVLLAALAARGAVDELQRLGEPAGAAFPTTSSLVRRQLGVIGDAPTEHRVDVRHRLHDVQPAGEVPAGAYRCGDRRPVDPEHLTLPPVRHVDAQAGHRSEAGRRLHQHLDGFVGTGLGSAEQSDRRTAGDGAARREQPRRGCPGAHDVRDLQSRIGVDVVEQLPPGAAPEVVPGEQSEMNRFPREEHLADQFGRPTRRTRHPPTLPPSHPFRNPLWTTLPAALRFHGKSGYSTSNSHSFRESARWRGGGGGGEGEGEG